MRSESKGILTIGGAPFHWGSRTYIMGVLNVTPDSFSDGGRFIEPGAAIEQALALVEQGADIIDIGGESTRPGASKVTASQEKQRILPVIEAVAPRLRERNVPVSVDTYKAEVAAAAVEAGATIINDVWGLQHPGGDMAQVAAEYGVPVVVMHNKERAQYDDDLITSIRRFFDESVSRAINAGVPRDHIIFDPGFGFGKTLLHNLEITDRLAELRDLGPILWGPSRKSTIGKILDLPTEERVEGTIAFCVMAIRAGADIVRVHDVKEVARAARIADAVCRGYGEFTPDPRARRTVGPSPAEAPPTDICLEGLRFHANHGLLDWERDLGQPFTVDVKLTVRRPKNGGEVRSGVGSIDSTVDYTRVYQAVSSVVQDSPFDLIEDLAEAIADRLLDAAQFPLVQRVVVQVSKPHAPIGGLADNVKVRVERGHD